MKQSSFEIRQRADELIRKAISIWRQSNNEEALDGIENDPVFSMMLTALAHESNDLDAEINKFRQGIYEEFSTMMVPYGVNGAMPATAAITLMPQTGIPEVRLSDTSTFFIEGSSFQMMPLLESTAFNLRVSSLRRIDGRRWTLGLDFATMVTDLSGWTFAINGVDFSGLRIFFEDREVPVVCPWDPAEMPFVKCFSFDGMLYNHTPVYYPANTCMELFAKQDLKVFYISKLQLPQPAAHIELILEFGGVNSDFVFKSSNFTPNAVILVNAQCKDVTLDSDKPIFRLEDNKLLMHLIRPEDDQIFGNTKVVVRKLGGDRFNESSLLKLLNLLINRFSSDYYAFMAYGDKEIDEAMTKLQMLIERMTSSLESKTKNRITGTYLLLGGSSRKKQLSVDVHYVMTDGDACNSMLNQNTKFSTASIVDRSSIKMIAAPSPGFGEMSSQMNVVDQARYYMSCNDRIVTPADIKVFCYSMLMTRFGIAREMIDGVSVSRMRDSSSATGYSISVKVTLKSSSFIKDFSNRMSSARIVLEKMLAVRSTGIYPIKLELETTK